MLIDVPGQARKELSNPLGRLADEGVNNKLYGVLVVTRHLLLSVDPERSDVVDIAELIEEGAAEVGFRIGQLGFPDDWRSSPIWDRDFVLDQAPMLAASLLDRTGAYTAPEARAALYAARAKPADNERTEAQQQAAKRAAQKDLLRTYLRYQVVVEIELGETKYYPRFQFRDGKIIDSLAEINKRFAEACGDAHPAQRASAILDWWQAPHPGCRGPRTALHGHRSTFLKAGRNTTLVRRSARQTPRAASSSHLRGSDRPSLEQCGREPVRDVAVPRPTCDLRGRIAPPLRNQRLRACRTATWGLQNSDLRGEHLSCCCRSRRPSTGTVPRAGSC